MALAVGSCGLKYTQLLKNYEDFMNDYNLELENWHNGYYPFGFKLGPVNLKLKPGRIVALVGSNGSGKTTLLQSIVGLLPHQKGQCNIFGQARHVNDEDVVWKQQLGFVADDPLLYEDLSLKGNLKRLSPHYPTWNPETFDRLLAQCPLPLGQKPMYVSKGQRMAFALMVALSYHPRLMILDEPTAGLDPKRRELFLDEIMERAVGDDQATVLLSTHILSDVARVADEVCFLRNGEIDYHQDRESLTDDWFKVSFRYEGQVNELPRVLRSASNGPSHLVITDRFSEFKVMLAERLISIHEARPMNVEEVAAYLLGGKNES